MSFPESSTEGRISRAFSEGQSVALAVLRLRLRNRLPAGLQKQPLELKTFLDYCVAYFNNNTSSTLSPGDEIHFRPGAGDVFEKVQGGLQDNMGLEEIVGRLQVLKGKGELDAEARTYVAKRATKREDI